ncbi:MAG TPA: asparagine synthase (glutamine-hydrolyzing) [Candidatus Thermoplasmatota archaeon]|nr:asparagine synthase (glutamine-hydrolyzing) [Candidatus Thermoplasmatota archaeon]
MCGIAGYRVFGRLAPADVAVIRRMTDVMRHRGPNDEGQLLLRVADGARWDARDAAPPIEHDVALGNRRLAIVDLSPAGHMPMWDAAGEFAITYNGEVYNFIELRAELEKRGHSFRTGTDTEVILASYREWGVDCLSRFNGMFAFALYDSRDGSLFCARDRFGVKPFYYHHANGLFVFGSEIKVIIEHPGVPRRPDDAAVHDYLALRLVDHTERTFFEGILQLPGSHALRLHADGRLQRWRWYEARAGGALASTPEEKLRLVSLFRATFEDAVRIRLRSDVPVGTCLSGGLDSSSIVVVANRLMFDELKLDRSVAGEHQRTFTAGFDDARFDERQHVQKVIASTGADNKETLPTHERFWEDLPRVIWHMDEPFQSTSQYTQWCVMRLARESGVTVTLDGQGSDEVLGGYPGYHGVLVATLLARGRLRSAARAARAVPDAVSHSGPPRVLARAAYALLPGPLRRASRAAMRRVAPGLAPEGAVLRLMRPEFARAHRARRESFAREQARLMRDLPARLEADTLRYSLPALLRYEDRSSMAFSVEARTPFLDYRLVEVGLSLPADLRISDGWTKLVLRQAMEGLLPPEIQWRRDKKGFVTPEVAWLRANADHIRALFTDGRTLSYPYVDPARVAALLDEVLAAKGDKEASTEVWRIVNLELWMRVFFVTEAAG